MNKNHSFQLRIWHWLDAIVVTGLVITFFLRNALVKTSRHVIAKLADSGVQTTDEMTRPIVKEMVRDLWAWHIYLGYALAALLIFRIVLMFTDGRNPVAETIHAAKQAKAPLTKKSAHQFCIKAGYMTFYILQLFMVLSGLTLVYGESMGLSKAVTRPISQTHEAVMWFFLGFAILHVIGVFVAENTDGPGLVSAMVGGGS